MCYSITYLAARLNHPEVGKSARHIMITLSSFADKNGKCWPSLGRIAELTGYSKQSVRNALQVLVKLGFVAKERKQRPDGGDTTYEFTVNADALKRGHVFIEPDGETISSCSGTVTTFCEPFCEAQKADQGASNDLRGGIKEFEGGDQKDDTPIRTSHRNQSYEPYSDSDESDDRDRVSTRKLFWQEVKTTESICPIRKEKNLRPLAGKLIKMLDNDFERGLEVLYLSQRSGDPTAYIAAVIHEMMGRRKKMSDREIKAYYRDPNFGASP